VLGDFCVMPMHSVRLVEWVLDLAVAKIFSSKAQELQGARRIVLSHLVRVWLKVLRHVAASI
jgi:hypothetical protein